MLFRSHPQDHPCRPMRGVASHRIRRQPRPIPFFPLQGMVAAERRRTTRLSTFPSTHSFLSGCTRERNDSGCVSSAQVIHTDNARRAMTMARAATATYPRPLVLPICVTSKPQVSQLNSRRRAKRSMRPQSDAPPAQYSPAIRSAMRGAE